MHSAYCKVTPPESFPDFPLPLPFYPRGNKLVGKASLFPVIPNHGVSQTGFPQGHLLGTTYLFQNHFIHTAVQTNNTSSYVRWLCHMYWQQGTFLERESLKQRSILSARVCAVSVYRHCNRIPQIKWFIKSKCVSGLWFRSLGNLRLGSCIW
jgi:hypothetical protein